MYIEKYKNHKKCTQVPTFKIITCSYMLYVNIMHVVYAYSLVYLTCACFHFNWLTNVSSFV